ncbi:hypothetical protein PC9H_011397 [Pleurotus ostreatus]|uniref:DUF6534 domain-containing protein n=1 Tax=Pleurotus ostreatus TaxID=5322 RepID=A0A8H6ZIN8_PLEOS|nr:uncharacterized protein PC9H_011397 [Pleurotus ostreatus]KAF7420879.1 hypothetical protein PC9H_011397 [Pleurotus ostreatus]
MSLKPQVLEHLNVVSANAGALHASSSVSGILLGCLVVQSYVYYKKHYDDPLGVKILVVTLVTSEIAQQLCMIDADYTLAISNWGNPTIFFRLPASLWATIVISVLNSPLVESFYFWRIYKISQRMWPSVIGTFLSWLRCAGWLVFASTAAQQGSLTPGFIDDKSWLIITLVAFGLVTNGFLAAVMVYYLIRNRHTPFRRMGVPPRTKLLIDRLIMWTVQTSIITGLAYAATLILFITLRNTLIWFGILACTTKVCANCLLSSLNDRAKIRVHTKSEALSSSDVPMQPQSRRLALPLAKKTNW